MEFDTVRIVFAKMRGPRTGATGRVMRCPSLAPIARARWMYPRVRSERTLDRTTRAVVGQLTIAIAMTIVQKPLPRMLAMTMTKGRQGVTRKKFGIQEGARSTQRA